MQDPVMWFTTEKREAASLFSDIKTNYYQKNNIYGFLLFTLCNITLAGESKSWRANIFDKKSLFLLNCRISVFSQKCEGPFPVIYEPVLLHFTEFI